MVNMVQVRRSSFYHYFESEEAFGIVLKKIYADYFNKCVNTSFSKEDLTPIKQLQDFIFTARANMQKYDFTCGRFFSNPGQ